jgi:hypothetical protein
MKIVKLVMLVAIAAIAAMAFIGASSASATPPWIAVCLKAELLNCKNLAKHPLPGRLIGLGGPGKFNAGFVTLECAGSEGWSVQIESQQKGESSGTLESMTLNGCKGCTGVALKTPQTATLTMETEIGNWRSISNGVKVKFTGCPLSQSCTYEANLNLEVQMNETEAFTEPKGAEFKKIAAESTALCAEKGKWETGKATFDWELDDAPFPNGTRHKNVFPSLIGKELIKVP